MSRAATGSGDHVVVPRPSRLPPPTYEAGKVKFERRGKRMKIIVDKDCLVQVNPLEEEFGFSSDSGDGIWSRLKKRVAESIDDSVASLASFHTEGDSFFFACTGIIIESNTTTTRLLTSLSLVRSIDDDSNIFHDMKIEVRLPNNFLCNGCLEYYDLKYNVAIVSVPPFYVFDAVCLDYQRPFEPASIVLAVGRCFNSGMLMATTGVLTDNRRRAYRDELAVSTCEITMTGVGGPLVYLNGDFVGMNFYAKEETPFLPRDKILEILMQFKSCETEKAASKAHETPDSDNSDSEGSSSEDMRRRKKKPSICTICESVRKDTLVKSLPYLHRWPKNPGSESVQSSIEWFSSRGYPLPVLDDCCIRLRYNFEEQFREVIWRKLTKRVASNMSRSVVALDSSIGGERLFACTGVCIDWNGSATRVLTSGSLVRSKVDESKVADGLKINVILPDKRHVSGTLQHCNLHYNVAVVIVDKFRCTRTTNIDNNVKTGTLSKVSAIGRIYDSGKLMAASGILIDKKSELNCEELKISTCEITKAGIGGPLIDFNGNFIGMNFYGLEETPYLPKDIILKLLKNFDLEGTVAADFTKVPDPNKLNRWPVPKPYWCYPSWHREIAEMDEMEEVDMVEFEAQDD